MKKILFGALAAATMIAGSASAQITLNFVQHIDVGGLESVPTGITSDPDGDLIVVGFGNRRVIEIQDFESTTSAAASITYRSDSTDTPAGPYTWLASRGLITANTMANGNILIAGQVGNGPTPGPATDGGTIILDTTTNPATEVAVQATDITGTPRPIAGAVSFPNGNVMVQFTAGTNFYSFNSTIDGFTGSAFYTGPAPGVTGAVSRDMAIDSNNIIYVSWGNAFIGDGLGVGFHRIVDEGSQTLGGGDTNESDWFSSTLSATNSTSVVGCAVGTIDSTEYVLQCVRSDATITFLETTAASVAAGTPIVITDAELEVPSDAVIVQKGGSTYLAVTQFGRSVATPPNVVSVFEITTPALGVNDWTLYQ